MKKIFLISTLLLILICVMASCSLPHQWSERQSSKGVITVNNTTPFTTYNTFGSETGITIEQVDVTQKKSNIKITVSGTKTYDEYGQTANNYC